MKYLHLNSPGLKQEYFNDIKNIFFESSSVHKFDNEEQKAHFADTWLSYYCTAEHPGMVYVALKQNMVLGYLAGCTDSLEALKFYANRVSSYNVFKDLFSDFPAHLHINLTTSARGHGVGSGLVNTFCEALRLKHVPGIHIVTSANARNISFYQKNGFTYTEKRLFNGHELLFMGKKLT